MYLVYALFEYSDQRKVYADVFCTKDEAFTFLTNSFYEFYDFDDVIQDMIHKNLLEMLKNNEDCTINNDILWILENVNPDECVNFEIEAHLSNINYKMV